MNLSKQFSQALHFANSMHGNQLRKGGQVPYMAHLLSVVALVLEHGGSENEAIAALLHDVIEDRGRSWNKGHTGMRNELRKRFGEEVLGIIEECTDTDEYPKPPWRERKEAYLVHLEQASTSGLLVSLADKVHNLRSILADYRIVGDELWTRFKGGKEGTLWYYDALLHAFKTRQESQPELLAELERARLELAKLMAV
jgi:GTP pyrophosphokinase